MTSLPQTNDLDASSSSEMSSDHSCCHSTCSRTSPRSSPALGSRIRRRMGRVGTKFSISDHLARQEQRQLTEEIKICKCYVKSLEQFEKQKKQHSEHCNRRFAREHSKSLSEEIQSIEEELKHQLPQISQSECLSSVRRGHSLLRGLRH